MPPTVAQRSAISQFCSITGGSERSASSILKKHNWKLDAACDAFFQQTPGVATPVDKSPGALPALFAKYRDPINDPKDTVSVDGTMTYLTELGINLEDCSSLIPLYIVQAPSLGEMTVEGFVEGWVKVKATEKKDIDTIPKQKAYIQRLATTLSTNLDFFKQVYKYTFICSKERAQKALPLENALIYWQMLFSPPGMKWQTENVDFLNLWVEFLEKNWTKSVNKDMWNQTLEFYIKSMKDENLTFWDENGAWPSVIDDFVVYVREKRGLTVGVADTMETD